MRHYAVVPTHNRPTELAELLDSIPADVEVLVIDNASTPPVPLRMLEGKPGGGLHYMIRDEEQPPNLSRLWNIGLDWAHVRSNHDPDWRRPALDPRPEYAVTVLNDDVVLPPGFFDLMGSALTATNTDIAFPCPLGQPDLYINREKPFPGLGLRMMGWCFTVRGSSGLRADERLRWWCGDDDLQASAVQHGRGTVGVFFAPGTGPKHRYPDQSTVGVLREQTARDMDTFVEKWGQRPW